MAFEPRSLRFPRLCLAAVAVTAAAGCGGGSSSPSSSSSSSGGSGSTSSSAASSGTSGTGGVASSSSSGTAGAATTSSSGMGGGGSSGTTTTTATTTATTTTTTTTSTTTSSSSGSVGGDLCGAPSGAVAWTATIPASSPILVLSDVILGPTSDVIVADNAGGMLFEQHRWDHEGAVVSVHQDPNSGYLGAMLSSNLFVDAQNGLFYGLMLTGLPQGTHTQAELLFNKISPDGSVVFSDTTTSLMNALTGAPSLFLFDVGGDSGGNLHGALSMITPWFPAGVYCYGSSGSNLGISAASTTANLTGNAFEWPAPDANLYATEGVNGTVNFGCSGGVLNPPAGGAQVLAAFSGSGNCLWNKLLALPTAAVKATNFRLGADGSMMFAVVYKGTIDFGGGALTSTGTSALALARFDTGGNLLWAKSFGGAGSSFTIGSVGANATGDVMLTGGYAGTVDLGGGALPASADTFVAVFTAAGALEWAHTVKVGAQGGLVAAVGACGVAVATNSPTVDFGTGPLSSVTPPDAASIGVAALGL